MPQLSREIRRQRNLFDNAVCLSVQLAKIGNRRQIPTSKVDVGVETDPTWINVSKQLLESKTLQALNQLDGEIRKYLYARSVPSGFFKGLYIVSLPIVEDVDIALRQYSDKRRLIVEQFLMEYPQLRDDAKVKLNDKWEGADYPDVLQVAQSFSMDWAYVAFSTPENLSCASQDILEREQAKMEVKMMEIGDSISQLLLAEMTGLVDNMVDKLKPNQKSVTGKAKQPRIYSSYIDNFREFMANFKYRNLSDNTDLDLMVDRCRALLEGVDAESLRDSETVRLRVQESFRTVREELEGMVVDKPARAIRVVD